MDGGKPTVPENMRGTLTSSDYNFAHTSNSTKVMYKYYAVATLEHLELFRPANYIYIIAISSDLLRVFFYSKIFSIRYSTTIKSSPLTISI